MDDNQENTIIDNHYIDCDKFMAYLDKHDTSTEWIDFNRIILCYEKIGQTDISIKDSLIRLNDLQQEYIVLKHMLCLLKDCCYNK